MYRICIRGRVSRRLAAAFEGMRLDASGADAAFTGEIRDQSQLYGLLDRVRDLGLDLISVYPQAMTNPVTEGHEKSGGSVI
jgi:hypothetical protein